MIRFRTGVRRRTPVVVRAAGVGALFCTVLAGAGSISSSAGASSYTYNIAILGAETGPDVPSVPGEINGALSAIHAINAAGGVNGHQIQDKVYDTQSTTTGGLSALRQVLGSNPNAIVIADDSSVVGALLPTLAQAGIPTVENVGETATNPKLSRPGGFLFGSSITGNQFNDLQISTAEQALKVKSLKGVKVATEVLNAPTAVASSNIFIKELKQMGAIIVNQTLDPLTGLTSFSSQATTIAAKNPAVYFSDDTASSVPVQFNALKTAGYKGWFIGNPAQYSDALYEQLASPKFITSADFQNPQPGSAPVTAAKQAGLDSSGAYFSNGWVQAYEMAAGLKKCTSSSCSSKTVISNLQNSPNIKIPGNVTFGTVGFTPKKHNNLNYGQVFVWDSSSQKVVPFAKPVYVGNITN